jgi:hypothetical protein
MDEFSVETEIIKIRKDFLTRWFVKVVSADYNDPKTWEYGVGWMHSSINGKPAMVGYMHCGSLLGWVVGVLIPAVLSQGLDEEQKSMWLVSLNKVVWIQNDLFARHYMKDSTLSDFHY